MELTDERHQRFEHVVAKSQFDLAILLENVHDPHNIGAVLRTCDSVGIRDVYILNTDSRITMANLNAGKKSSSGARKWIRIHYFDQLDSCVKEIKEKYSYLFVTHLDEQAKSVYDLNFCDSMAIAFGNEHDGISKELKAFANGNFIIPQVGMVKSLNISVACAISLYEVFRQRNLAGAYQQDFDASNSKQALLFERFLARHKRRKT